MEDSNLRNCSGRSERKIIEPTANQALGKWKSVHKTVKTKAIYDGFNTYFWVKQLNTVCGTK